MSDEPVVRDLPQEAVEAAAKAIWKDLGGTERDWMSATHSAAPTYRRNARAALTAALPHLGPGDPLVDDQRVEAAAKVINERMPGTPVVDTARVALEAASKVGASAGDPERLAQIRERLEKATPRPWESWAENDDTFGVCRPEEVPGEIGDCSAFVATCDTEADADLIANAPSDIAYLLSLVTPERAQHD